MARLVFIPQLCSQSFLHLSPRGESFRARRYWRDERNRPQVKVVLSSQDRLFDDEQVQRMITVNLPAPYHRLEDKAFWADEIVRLNREYGLGSQAPTADHRATASNSRSVLPPWPPATTRTNLATESTKKAESTPPHVPQSAQVWQRPLHAALNQLIKDFHEDGNQFFSEREIHAQFFGYTRDSLGTRKTADGHVVHLCRSEYNSVFRYRRANEYQERYLHEGTPLSFDFAVLNEDFVQKNSLLTVINKDESLRPAVRSLMAKPHLPNPAIAAAIEFKFAKSSTSLGVGQGAINQLKQSMQVDARKLAQERIQYGYVIGFAHGAKLSHPEMETIAQECSLAFSQIWPHGRLCVVLATRDHVFRHTFRPLADSTDHNGQQADVRSSLPPANIPMGVAVSPVMTNRGAGSWATREVPESVAVTINTRIRNRRKHDCFSEIDYYLRRLRTWLRDPDNQQIADVGVGLLLAWGWLVTRAIQN